MGNYKLRDAVHRAIVAGAVTSMMGSAQCVIAANADVQPSPALEEVVVTGSRIQRADLQSVSPLTEISQEDIKLQGTVNISDVLNQLPQVIPGLTSSYNNGSDGSTTIDLRGLGDQRTLVLIDGKRALPKDETGVVDLNAIPVGLIERVDVVTGGASATYGSDAISGVVNFIMNKHFEGVQIDAQHYETGHQDGKTEDLSVLIGTNSADNKGNITLYANYTHRAAILQGARSFDSVAYGASGGKLIPLGSGSAFPSNVYDAATGYHSFDAHGNITPSGTTYNFNPTNYLQLPQERYALGALGHYEINDHAEVFANLQFSSNNVVTQLAPTPTQFFQFNTTPNNPYLPAASVATLAQYSAGLGLSGTANGINPDGTVPFLLGRRLFELGPRIEGFDRTAFSITLGVRGDIIGDWKYEIFTQQQQTNLSQYELGDVNKARFQQALLAVPDGSGGVACQDPSGGCVPINVFSTSQFSAAGAKFVSENLSATDLTTQRIYGVNISGDLGDYVKSPWAKSKFGVAVGAEYRKDTADFQPDDNLATNNLIGFGASPAIKGEFSVKEVFMEADLPILEDLLLAKSLVIDGGFRHSDYDTATGGVNTFKGGLTWAPIAEMNFRGGFQRAVRAPSIFELFQPQAVDAENFVDPCAGNAPTASQAICAATGATRYGAIQQTTAGQGNGLRGGNPGLGAETADTFTLGIVAKPLPDLNASIDYYSIKLTGAIELFDGSAQNVLTACYSQTDPNNPACLAVHRNPVTQSLVGDITGYVNITNFNAGYIKTNGVDFAVDYKHSLPGSWGSVGGDFTGTYVTLWDQQLSPTTGIQHCVGTFGNICEQPLPRFSFNLRGTWRIADFTMQARYHYLGGVEYDAYKFGSGSSPTNFIPSYGYVDLTASYEVVQGLTVRAGVNNLFQKLPPVLGNDVQGPSNFGSGNTFPGTYDALGRAYFVGATVKF